MPSRTLQTLLSSAIPLVLMACTQTYPAAAYPAASPPLGVDLGSSGQPAAQPAAAARPAGEGHEIRPPAAEPHAQLVHEGQGGASAAGTVNSVDVAGRRVNVSHGAIQAFGWPPMTMDFPVAPAVNLNAIKPGTKVNFTLDKGRDGMPVIDTMTPVGGGL